jgi:hypothetical protein
MDLADLQGTGSRLTLVSKKVPTSADKNQEYLNLEITRDSADNNPKVPTSADKVPTDFQQGESITEQEFQEINIQSADTADRLGAAEITSQPPKVEPGNNTDLSSADKNDSFKEVVGTSALEDESLTQQGDIGVGNSSAVHRHSSAVDKFLPSNPSTPPKNSRIFERGDRVVVKDVGGIYQGARGHVVDILESRAGTSYLVKFDKPIKNIPQIKVKASDLMKL